jgi:hypothetical protein
VKAFTLALLAFVVPLRADDFDTWFALSPDKTLVGVERRMPDKNEPSRLDLDGCVVFVCAASEGGQRSVIAQHSFSERVVSGISWSPDSRFLLFTTASSGGHLPWHFKTYVYCVADKSFRDVESVAGGSIGAAEFHFESPDVAVLQLHQPDGDAPKPIRIALDKAMERMERLP